MVLVQADMHTEIETPGCRHIHGGDNVHAITDLASFTDETTFGIGSRRVRPGLPRRLRNTGWGGPSLKGLSTIAWGWHGSAYPRLPIPPTTQL